MSGRTPAAPLLKNCNFAVRFTGVSGTADHTAISPSASSCCSDVLGLITRLESSSSAGQGEQEVHTQQQQQRQQQHNDAAESGGNSLRWERSQLPVPETSVRLAFSVDPNWRRRVQSLFGRCLRRGKDKAPIVCTVKNICRRGGKYVY